jgi:uncharacterized protein (TIGR03435 family)
MSPRRSSTGLILASLISTIHAQALGPPFDVASVKIAEQATMASELRRSGGRITWTTTMTALMVYAYQIPDYRISGLEGGPGLIAVQAETDAAATDDQIRLMFQRLLTERFQLAVHRESRDGLVFSLVATRGGPKLRRVKPDDSVSAPPPSFYQGVKVPEGSVFRYMVHNHSALIGRRVTVQQLADVLADFVRASVADKTGLQGTFDFDLNFSDNTPGPNDDVPSIFTALQDQLGLKLQKQTAPVEILVVDHIEKKPTPN